MRINQQSLAVTRMSPRTTRARAATILLVLLLPGLAPAPTIAVSRVGYVAAGTGRRTGGVVGGELPAPVDGLAHVVAVAGAYGASLILTRDGAVWARGDNRFGQLGDGTTTDRRGLVRLRTLTSVVAIAAGARFGLAVRSDGTVWAWGRNQAGQLGLGTSDHRIHALPRPVPGLGGVTAVAAGDTHSLALRQDGTVWAWGANDDGQLGARPSDQPRATPAAVPTLRHIVAVAAGAGFSVAIKDDGTVWTWGLDDRGQVGLGARAARVVSVPTRVPDLSDIIAIAAGRDHCLALGRDGAVYAWGDNRLGELGDGVRSDARGGVPTRVRGLANVVAIGAGWRRGLALDGNGAVRAWGNSDGRHDDLTPAPAPHLSDLLAIPGAYSFALPRTRPLAPATLSGSSSPALGALLDDLAQGYRGPQPAIGVASDPTGDARVIAQWTGGTDAFALGDTLLSVAQQNAAVARCRSDVVTLPVAVVPMALVYNLPGVGSALRLTPDLVAGMLLGDVQSWQNPAIAALNPGRRLPFRAIDVLSSPDAIEGSILTQFLTAASPRWRAALAGGAEPVRAIYLGGNGAPDIASEVAQTPESFAYVGLAAARAARLPVVALQNTRGYYQVASLTGAGAAAAGLAGSLPVDLRQVLAPAPSGDAYPLSGYAYLDLCGRQTGAAGAALVDFARYMVTAGQAAVARNHLTTLPPVVRDRDLAALDTIAARSAAPSAPIPTPILDATPSPLPTGAHIATTIPITTATVTATETTTMTATATLSATPSDTAMATATPLPPTDTATATATPVLPTATATSTSTDTPTATTTPTMLLATVTPTATATPTTTATSASTPVAAPTRTSAMPLAGVSPLPIDATLAYNLEG